MKQKVKSLAKDIYDNHFRVAQSQPRGVVAKLKSIVDEMNKAGMCKILQKFTGKVIIFFAVKYTIFFFKTTGQAQILGQPWKDVLMVALKSLVCLLKDENIVSAYELHSSGLIQSLLQMFAVESKNKKSIRLQRHRVEVFRNVFGIAQDDFNLAAALVKKLIAVLESIEKLPIYLYDNSTSSGYGLQILTRRLRFRLERAPGENGLIDRTGCTLKMEPLASIRQLERYATNNFFVRSKDFVLFLL